ncbi:ubiquitin-like domain-containing protein CIP73 isoform X1 [Cannabis sativa]|uniref:ubiquitin-like domain-containing protein CIP73 isoform X1 n=1 Tax=Cannabis sativa TaxID=3483 RepID=UPI0029CA190F|nr:ubiquitin-like domain-containing protein CIP73 isoform X1 [Cannabis sativa]
MASKGVDLIPDCDAVEASEADIEIKIKTLDSQTYTLKVDKQVPVPALKEQIASVTGVLSEQQRLICRGKVLKDDQLLSAYHVEDGHTLHLVVRQPYSSPPEGLLNHPATDPASSTSRSHSTHIAPGVVIETFSLPVQGDGAPPEISRILSAVLGSIGISNVGSSNEGMDNREHGPQRSERTSGASSFLDSLHLQSDQSGSRMASDRSLGIGTFGHSSAFSLGSQLPPHVIPDSLTTLTQYLSNMRREFDAIGRDGADGRQESASNVSEDTSSQSASGTRRGLPTPASLAEVMLSARQLLTEQASERLLQLVGQLENQVNVTDVSLRSNIQTSTMRSGALFHSLGAFLLELGRTMMTLRLGETPSEAVVNAGPAVFISPTGPNPIMVQPLPFQVGTSLGAIPMGAVHAGSGLVNGLGNGLLPRRIDIQIRRGSSTSAANVNRQEQGNGQQPSGQQNPATSAGGEIPVNQGTARVSDAPGFAGESAVRVVPLRTMVAAVPGPFGRLPPSDSSGNSMGLYYPVLGRFQHVAPGHLSGDRGAQASGERHAAHAGGLHPEQQSTESAAQQRAGDSARDGPNPRQQESLNARSVSINILSAGGMQNNDDSDRQLPSNVMQFIRNLFPGGEIHVEDGSSEEAGAGSTPDQARTSSGPQGEPEAEPSPSEEGIFFSNLLRQIMPVISRQAVSESDTVHPEQASPSEPAVASDAGTSHQAENSTVGVSRRHDDCESSSPNSKRQKVTVMEILYFLSQIILYIFLHGFTRL